MGNQAGRQWSKVILCSSYPIKATTGTISIFKLRFIFTSSHSHTFVNPTTFRLLVWSFACEMKMGIPDRLWTHSSPDVCKSKNVKPYMINYERAVYILRRQVWSLIYKNIYFETELQFRLATAPTPLVRWLHRQNLQLLSCIELKTRLKAAQTSGYISP